MEKFGQTKQIKDMKKDLYILSRDFLISFLLL